MIDRHLGLCYNRPLAMLDNECEDLFQPVPDTAWQAGEFYTGHPGPRRKGLNFQCTSHDVFGFFLPLMTILGDIVDLNAQKNHPRFGQRTSWELHEQEITRQLESYAYSIEDFKAQHGCGQNDDVNQTNGTPDPVRMEWVHQTRKIAAYATHIMHVLHILLHGKWDPVALLEDDNMWICSPSFLAATSNAISAAHAVEEILDLDPDLSFMPYLFGMVRACFLTKASPTNDFTVFVARKSDSSATGGQVVHRDQRRSDPSLRDYCPSTRSRCGNTQHRVSGKWIDPSPTAM